MLSGMISSVSGKVNITGENLTVDSDALFQSTSTNNIAIGLNALNSTGADSDNNIGIGVNALTAITTGDGNTSIGYQAGKSLTTSGDNLAIGYKALENATTAAHQNIAIGTLSMDGA